MNIISCGIYRRVQEVTMDVFRPVLHNQHGPCFLLAKLARLFSLPHSPISACACPMLCHFWGSGP